MSKIADTLGISRQVVQATVRGNRNNRKVLQLLKEMGCPEQHLSLPEDMRG
jgi:biotin operon repressor